ncbi:hypothetical protein Q5424_29185, partial [Conexibacter sp. JD483]
RGEWALLAGGVAVVAGLALAGAPAGSSSDRAPVRADAGAGSSAQQPARPGTRTTLPTTPTTPGATATTPAGTPRPPGTLGNSGPTSAASNGRDASGIAIRRQPARAGDGTRAAGRGSGSGVNGSAGTGARSGTGAGSTARRRTQSSVAPQPAASLPSPRQVKEFAAEGRRATAPLAAGAPSRSGRAGGDGARGVARSGTRGAGSQTGRSGSGTAARPTTGAGAE